MALDKKINALDVVAAYNSGMSFYECGDKFNVSDTTIRRLLLKYAPECIRSGGQVPNKPRQGIIFIPEITGTTLEQFFTYNPSDGFFRHKTWRGPRGGGPNSIAGSVMQNGYIMIGLPGSKKVLAHRLVWLWMTGEWPEFEIDHVNRNRADNRFENLREATRPQNSQNGSIRSNNTTGVPGVYFDKSRDKYVASVMVNYKTVFRRRYDSFEDAVVARLQKERELFGEFSPNIQTPS